ncbi:MAG: APC family permease [Actinomycetales bacterium]|nr:APC family permease [Actinomycetales bacterium]
MADLQRRLGVAAATGIGVASMLGAGVFFVWAPATAAAGWGVVLALPLAALAATLNALSTTQLAMAHPVSGGAYAYARAEWNPTLGVPAGVLFLLGKTASVAAIASVAAAYLVPEAGRTAGAEGVPTPDVLLRPAVAVALVVLLAIVNATGIRSTAVVSGVIAAIVVATLLVVLAVALAQGAPGAAERLAPPPLDPGPWGVFPAAALIFFAFAGYARIATLGEEVRDPRRTLPRAVVLALGSVLLLSGAVLAVLLVVLGPSALAASASPLADAAGPGFDVVIRLAAALACLGSLLGVLAGLSRTTLALARDGELPAALAAISPRSHAPIRAEVLIALVGVVATLVLPPAALVGVSAAAVLGYYGIAHLAALRQSPLERWLPRAVPALGLVLCAALALSAPWPAVLGVAAAVGLVLLVRALSGRRRRAAAAGSGSRTRRARARPPRR